MSVSLTFTADTPSELHSSIAAFLAASGNSIIAPAGAKTPATKTETKAPAKVEEKAAEPDLIDETPAEVTEADVKKAAVAYQQKNGRDALAAALKAHGSPAGVSGIPVDKRADFIAYCEA